MKTRELIISYMDGLIMADAVGLHAKPILEQAMTFVYDSASGRADHLDGCHDDLLFATMIAAWVAHHERPERPKEDERVAEEYWSREPPKDDNKATLLSGLDDDGTIEEMLELYY